MNIEEFLSAKNEAFSKARGYEFVKEGIYEVMITEAAIKENKSTISKEPFCVYIVFGIKGPSHSGMHVRKFYDLDDEYIYRLKIDLKNMGFELDMMEGGISNLPGILDSMIYKEIRIKLVNKENRQNIYILNDQKNDE